MEFFEAKSQSKVRYAEKESKSRSCFALRATKDKSLSSILSNRTSGSGFEFQTLGLLDVYPPAARVMISRLSLARMRVCGKLRGRIAS